MVVVGVMMGLNLYFCFLTRWENMLCVACQKMFNLVWMGVGRCMICLQKPSGLQLPSMFTSHPIHIIFTSFSHHFLIMSRTSSLWGSSSPSSIMGSTWGCHLHLRWSNGGQSLLIFLWILKAYLILSIGVFICFGGTLVHFIPYSSNLFPNLYKSCYCVHSISFLSPNSSKSWLKGMMSSPVILWNQQEKHHFLPSSPPLPHHYHLHHHLIDPSIPHQIQHILPK